MELSKQEMILFSPLVYQKLPHLVRQFQTGFQKQEIIWTGNGIMFPTYSKKIFFNRCAREKPNAHVLVGLS